ncbi:nucleotidyltransferase family protein [Acetobacter sp. TBRC 12305]|uniref:Nucleotidyltransferase family protein n=1 Tax=Acetobacter garciniae TaxID=2817435 RepID=A0A939KQW6_9PROT|nr:nucleotidyltransferase family protein [Acetobacter garciniae]MBO1326019.1 nucleotidyltransferase family protein [Acetobacter garciniae]MBX0345237.1 nucleotidyltransferase family protein [Acetobacter garciniae]
MVAPPARPTAPLPRTLAGTLAGTMAIVLAAGRSSRTAPAHKLLAPDGAGRPMLARTLDAVTASMAAGIMVLLPPDQPDLVALAATCAQHDSRVGTSVVEHARLGLSQSLHAGVRIAQARQARCLLVCLGDMPLVPPDLLNTLMREQLATNAPATAPQCRGRAGNPVAWSHACFEQLLAIQGDKGGRDLLRALGPAVRLIPTPPAVLEDFDTPERLAAYATLGNAGTGHTTR